VSITAGAALACALAPLLALLSIASWSLALWGPYAAIALALVALVATHRGRGGRVRLMAWLALGTVGVWVLMGVAVGLELLYA